MIPVRASFSVGAYEVAAPTEGSVVLGTDRTYNYTRRPLVYCHGAGDTAETLYKKKGQVPLLHYLAQRYVVLATDLGGPQTWGNDLSLSRLNSAINYLTNQYGCNGKVTLVCGSMGFITGTNFALRNPDRVQAIAGIIPGTDIWDLYTNRGAAAAINAAYGGSYSNTIDGPNRDPVQFAHRLDPDLPIKTWYANNDLITVPSTQVAFVNARPQTESVNMGNIVPTGHSEEAIFTALPGVTAWLRQHEPVMA